MTNDICKADNIEILRIFFFLNHLTDKEHWYIILGLILVGVVVLSAVGVFVIKYCRRNKSSSGSAFHSGHLTSAIRKGFKTITGSGPKNFVGGGGGGGSVRSADSLLSISSASTSSRCGSYRGVAPIIRGDPNGNQQHPMTIPENQLPSSSGPRRCSKSPSLCGGIDPSQFDRQAYLDRRDDDKDDVDMSAISVDGIGKVTSSSSEESGWILGALHFTVEYDKHRSALIVNILRASNLPGKNAVASSSSQTDGTGTGCDPYVKLELLPERRQKAKTRVIHDTVDPVFDEIFTFYGIEKASAVVLRFVVLSFDRFARDDFLGEVVYPLSRIDLGDGAVTVCREIAPKHDKVNLLYLREVLCYCTRGRRCS